MQQIQDGRTKYLIASCKLVGSLACCSDAPRGTAGAVGTAVGTATATAETTRANAAPFPTVTGVERFTARTTGAVGACRLCDEALDRRLGCGTRGSKRGQADPAAVHSCCSRNKSKSEMDVHRTIALHERIPANSVHQAARLQ